MSAPESAARVIDRRVLLGGAVVLVLVAIGWLVWPSRSGPLVLKAGTAQHLVTVSIDSLRIGATDIDVSVTDRTGATKDHAAVQIQANQPLMGYAGQPVAALATGPGRFHATAVSLMMTGPWELRVSIDEHDSVDLLIVPLWVGG
ncbi:FixH family protein [Nocardia sp. NBC_00565]|uniref:FixH family protein n=1 Tax=Nocardia sp. NBC_00565 TaxID=2975993 RepID=UPI002E7FCE5F|nr:FixH family protein [Nocardia sp. NBC_00565]WUC05109.1 FixH family protein [Nocardia sp. NBC_00565]